MDFDEGPPDDVPGQDDDDKLASTAEWNVLVAEVRDGDESLVRAAFAALGSAARAARAEKAARARRASKITAPRLKVV